MASRHDELMNRICNAQIHAGEQEVLKHLAEIEGRPAPAMPKTFNDGLETAALYHEKLADVCETLGRDYTIDSAKHKDDALINRRHATEIRALKEQTNDG